MLVSHKSIQAQIATLTLAWHWDRRDHIINPLPLHHTHGLVNNMLCALWNGACCEFAGGFDAAAIWGRFLKGEATVFMAVPTVYYQLIDHWEKQDAAHQAALSAACKNFRLMVSGSAPLPVTVMQRWREISGCVLLERYGMTETGMVLGNPYEGPRVPGHVGFPFSGVETRLVDDNGQDAGSEPGELWVKGPSVFLGYWQNPEATAAAFGPGGWFKTGDMAVAGPNGHKIMGRKSIDIIKSGGYKISALEVESALLGHPGVKECAVVGLPDDKWGEKLAAAVVMAPGQTMAPADMRAWGKQWLPAYKVPSEFVFVGQLPRNALGKVVKQEVKLLFEGHG